MGRRRVFQPALVVALALGFLIGSPGVAFAKTTATPGYSYISASADCAWTEAWLSDQGGNPSLQSVGTMDWFNGSTCGDNAHVAGAQDIGLMQNLMLWTGSDWAICNTNAPFVTNPSASHDVWTGFGWSSPPCGAGFYRSWSEAWSWNQAYHSDTAILGNDWVIAQ
jgi:hypothetical protein